MDYVNYINVVQGLEINEKEIKKYKELLENKSMCHSRKISFWKDK
jgi:hypothetical protein